MKETVFSSPYLIPSEQIKTVVTFSLMSAQGCRRRTERAAEEGKIYPGTQQEVKLGLH